MVTKKPKGSVNSKFVAAIMYALKGECDCISCIALKEQADTIINAAQDDKK